jgi:hypothetical protein
MRPIAHVAQARNAITEIRIARSHALARGQRLSQRAPRIVVSEVHTPTHIQPPPPPPPPPPPNHHRHPRPSTHAPPPHTAHHTARHAAHAAHAAHTTTTTQQPPRHRAAAAPPPTRHRTTTPQSATTRARRDNGCLSAQRAPRRARTRRAKGAARRGCAAWSAAARATQARVVAGFRPCALRASGGHTKREQRARSDRSDTAMSAAHRAVSVCMGAHDARRAPAMWGAGARGWSARR